MVWGGVGGILREGCLCGSLSNGMAWGRWLEGWAVEVVAWRGEGWARVGWRVRVEGWDRLLRWVDEWDVLGGCLWSGAGVGGNSFRGECINFPDS